MYYDSHLTYGGSDYNKIDRTVGGTIDGESIYNSILNYGFTATPYNEQGEDNGREEMSLAYCCVCKDGVIAAADHRRTVEKGGINHYFDDAKKIFIYPETKSVLLTTGQISFGKDSDSISAQEIIESIPEREASTVAMQAYMRMVSYGPMQTKTSLWGVKLVMSDMLAVGRISKLEFGPQFFKGTANGVFTNNNIADYPNGNAHYNGESWAVSLLDSLDIKSDRTIANTLPDVKNALLFIQNNAGLVTHQKRTIGGGFTIAVITSKGIEIINI